MVVWGTGPGVLVRYLSRFDGPTRREARVIQGAATAGAHPSLQMMQQRYLYFLYPHFAAIAMYPHVISRDLGDPFKLLSTSSGSFKLDLSFVSQLRILRPLQSLSYF